MKLQLVGFVLVCILGACHKVNTNTNSTSFFNPKKLVEQQMVLLKNVGLKKIFTLNGKKNSVQLNQVDWKDEFNFLDEIDTDKAAFRNNLVMDSVQIGDTLIYNLNCIENKLLFKSATAKYCNKNLIELHIITATDNLIFNTQKNIIIKPNFGYSITGFINLNKALGKQTNYSINSTFLNIK